MKLAEAYVEIRIDRAKAKKEAKSAAEEAFGAIKKVFTAGVAIKGLQEAIGQASDLNETISKTGVIFGDSSKEITAWSQNSAKQLGLSQRAALDAASTFATFGKSAGLAGQDLTGFATNLTGLSSDLASFYNTSPETAIEAIGAALRGESEPIRQFGVLLDDATLKQRAMTMGLYDGKGALDQHARVLAAQAEILAQTSDAQGDFARTADGVANSQRIAAAEAEDSAASFGQVLLPVYKRVLDIVTFLVDKFGALPAPVQTAVVALAAFAAFSGPLKTVKGLIEDFSKALTKVGVSAGAQVTALALLGVAMVGLAAHQKLVADRNNEITRSINALSTASDAQVLNEFFNAFSEGLFKTKSAAGALDEIAQANIEGARRTLELGRATGENVPIFDALEAAIRKEEAAQAQATVTSDKYATTLDATGAAAKGAATGGLRTFSDAAHTAGQAALDAQVDTDAFNAAVSALRGTLDTREAVRNFEEAMYNYRAAAQPSEAETDAFIDKIIALITKLDDVPEETKTKMITLLDEGQLAVVESRLAFVARDRVISISGQLVGADLRNAQEGRGTQKAQGGYIPGRTNLLSTLAEQGPEAVLPLDKPNRLTELLGDPRIGGPVADALGGGGSTVATSVTTINAPITVYGAERSYVRSLRDQIRQLEREQT